MGHDYFIEEYSSLTRLAINSDRRRLSMHSRFSDSILRQLEVQLRQHEATLR
jgi:hypothetical protein